MFHTCSRRTDSTRRNRGHGAFWQLDIPTLSADVLAIGVIELGENKLNIELGSQCVPHSFSPYETVAQCDRMLNDSFTYFASGF
jgi:hypothetical protein